MFLVRVGSRRERRVDRMSAQQLRGVTGGYGLVALEARVLLQQHPHKETRRLLGGEPQLCLSGVANTRLLA